MELGGNITLVGFKEISKAELVVVKKIVGSYARKLSDSVNGFERLKVTLKQIHRTEGSEKFELNSLVVVDGDQSESEVVERNLFVGLDSVLHKVSEHAIRQVEKRMR
jgi:hypothetical protein